MDNISSFWSLDNIDSIYGYGKEYLYSLIHDYEMYIRDFGYIPISNFLKGWTCIPPSIFRSLKPGYKLFDINGTQVTIQTEPDPYDGMFIEAIDDINKSGFIIFAGELYAKNISHEDYIYKSIKPKGETLCPILITKTKQPQS